MTKQRRKFDTRFKLEVSRMINASGDGIGLTFMIES